MQLSRIRLKVQDAGTLADFYVDTLGMRDLGRPGSPAYGYDPGQCLLVFEAADVEAYDPSPNDLYWKIGIAVRDLDKAVAYLEERGWPVTAPPPVSRCRLYGAPQRSRRVRHRTAATGLQG